MIYKEAFSNCTSLETVTVPGYFESRTVNNNDTEISSVFYNNNIIKNVTITNGTTEIKDELFHLCGNIETVNIPNTVKKIGKSSFRFCSKLNVTIPDSVEDIGGSYEADWAFYNVPHIYYNGSAAGSPWGAKAIN